MLSGCANLYSRVDYRVSSTPDAKEVQLACVSSTSGQCHFLIGGEQAARHVVPTGGTLKVAAPAKTDQFCVSGAAPLRLLCSQQFGQLN